MKNEPFFSIITVSFNSAATIEKTLESLLSQTFSNFEYILIDGSSNDGTVSIIKKYEEKFKQKQISFKWISEKDSGIYDAMNKGIRMSLGKIIGIINSDDYYETNALEIVHQNAMKNPNYDVYHGLLKYYNSGNLISIKGESSDVLYNNMIQHPSTFILRSSYSKFGLFDTRYKYVADYDLLLRIKLEGGKFLFINEILANFFDGGLGDSIDSIVEANRLKKKYKLISRKKMYYNIFKTYFSRRIKKRN